MALSNLNLLSAGQYFSLLYDMIKQRENPWLYNGTGYEGIHNGGGDGNPTFGYGFNLAAFSANIVEAVILHAYNNSLTSQQNDGLDLILSWKTGQQVYVNGSWVTLSNANIINMADESLNGAPGAFGDSVQRAAVQSLTLTDAEATRMLDVMIKGDLNLVHVEGGSGSWGYEDGLDYRLAEEGVLPYSAERAALLSVYYNAPSLIGPGVQNAVASDDRPQLWYEIRYNHNHFDHNGLQNRRAEESDLLGLVSAAAKNNPDAHVDEYALALDTLFNGYDRLGNRILTRIEARDSLDNFEDAIASELQALLDYYVLEPLGASSAPLIDYVQADSDNISEQMIAQSVAGAGVSGGKGASDTINLILGMGGNDLIYGLGAADYLYGGGGNDTIYGDGGGTSLGDSGHDLIDGGDGDDVLYGGSGDEYILGGDGEDSIDGEAGNDVLVGGGGNDTLFGGQNNDMMDGDAGRDSLVGGSGADTVYGSGSHDSLGGGNDDDDLRGGDGRDLLNGGAGNDVLRGEEKDDRLFGGGGNDTLLGNDDNDSLTGGGGVDRLKGDAGDDTLNGRFGDDSVSGGAGDDLFEFRQGHGNDVYDDFVAGAGTDDVIELIAFGAAFDTFAEVIAAASGNGTHTTIDFGGGDSIKLLNVVVADLHEDDFIFS